MKRKTSPWLRALAGMALVALTACDVEGELDICPYNARLDYHYSPHGMERNERWGTWASIASTLFDEGGVLRIRSRCGARPCCGASSTCPRGPTPW